MKNLVCISLITLLLATSNLWANPFSTKVKKQIKQKPQPSVGKIVFKGYAVIGEQYFGFVQIGNTDFEVTEGDVINGIKIRKVTGFRLDYSIDNQRKFILLKSN